MLFRIMLITLLLCSCHAEEAGREVAKVKAAVNEALREPAQLPADTLIIDPAGNTVNSRISPPPGFRRVVTGAGTFAHYLQNFPLKADGTKVLLFDGREKYRQDVHAAVLDIDVGDRDLQQCADAVIRLRAEYLWAEKRYSDLHFNFTNGFRADYSKWRAGERILVQGNEVKWVNRATASGSYANFRRYLTMVFGYAGTLSLAQELKARQLVEISGGDVFIQGGNPGHAVLVMDKAVQESTGEVLILLAQSYMPAQDIHMLQNLGNESISPWYSADEFVEGVNTPEWRFKTGDLKKFESN